MTFFGRPPQARREELYMSIGLSICVILYHWLQTGERMLTQRFLAAGVEIAAICARSGKAGVLNEIGKCES